MAEVLVFLEQLTGLLQALSALLGWVMAIL